VDFITPAEQQSTQGNGGFCALTPAVLSPNRAKRPRNCTSAGGSDAHCRLAENALLQERNWLRRALNVSLSADDGDNQLETSADDQSGDPQHAGKRPYWSCVSVPVVLACTSRLPHSSTCTPTIPRLQAR